MFKGFIVLGVAYAVGWSQGYISGQNHTEELKDLLRDLRSSEETKKFFAEIRVAAEELAKRNAEEKNSEVVVDSDAAPLPPDGLDKIREN